LPGRLDEPAADPYPPDRLHVRPPWDGVGRAGVLSCRRTAQVVACRPGGHTGLLWLHHHPVRPNAAPLVGTWLTVGEKAEAKERGRSRMDGNSAEAPAAADPTRPVVLRECEAP